MTPLRDFLFYIGIFMSVVFNCRDMADTKEQLRNDLAEMSDTDETDLKHLALQMLDAIDEI